jgi:hypothetical protein
MDDGALVEGFEACSLPAAEFGHAEHVRVAWLYLASGAPFEEAALRFCKGLRRYAESLGKADRYHETITWAFLALVNERRHASGATRFDAFAEQNRDLFAPDLAALTRFYDRETLRSELARRVFLLPTIAASARSPASPAEPSR